MSKLNKIRSLLMLSVGGSLTFTSICIYKQNEKYFSDFVLPAVHLLDPETAHRVAVVSSKYRFLPRSNFKDPDVLKVKLFQQEFQNPIGIAAGFDKHGEAVQGLDDIGFGFVEVGSVTPKPQDGNEKPRVFRLSDDKAVINRYGFNSEGHDVVYERIKKIRADPDFKGVLGINLGKNKDSVNPVEDYVKGIEKFNDVADYLVINISSPNTPGLRDLQNKAELENLLKHLAATRNALMKKTPLLLKLAPDLSYQERKDVADIVKKKDCGVNGLIVSNTTVSRPNLSSSCKEEQGGLSGEPIKDISTKMIADMYKLTNGMTIIGVGGVSSGKDAYDKIKAGASVVQLYTSMVYGGPYIVKQIKRELAELLSRDHHKNVSEAVGKDV